MRSFSLVLAVALIGASAPAAAGPTSGARATVHSALPVSARSAAATVDAFHAALTRGDSKTAAALLANDALIYESGEAERSKAEYAAHHLSADAEFSRAVPNIVTRRTGSADGTLAWIASEGRMTGTFKGKPLDRVTTETMMLRRTESGWKISHIHWSSAAAK